MDQVIKLTGEQNQLAAALTTLQYKFVVNLVAGMCQSDAMKAAGSLAKSKNALSNSACKCLRRPEVRAFYDSLMETQIHGAVMQRDEAIMILSRNARVKMTDLADYSFVEVGKNADGDPIMQTVWTMKNSGDIDPDLIACIKSVTMTNKGPKIELHDQQAAIKQLSALEGWEAPKRTELSGIDGDAIHVTHIERTIV